MELSKEAGERKKLEPRMKAAVSRSELRMRRLWLSLE